MKQWILGAAALLCGLSCAPGAALAKNPNALAVSTKDLLGCWLETTPKQTKGRMIFNIRRGYLWKGTFGFWSVRGHKLWLVGKRIRGNQRVGELWRIKLKRSKKSKRLIFHNPEEFVYHGRGKYTYLRFRKPTTTRTFRFEKSLRPCLKDYVKRQKAKAKRKQKSAPKTR